MPSTIDATVGGSASNSYLSLADFALLADDGPYAATFVAADEAAQTRALLQATARLDLEKWYGVRVTDTQALAWPREYVIDPDKSGTNVGSTLARPYDLVVYLPTTTIPGRIRTGCAELALQILSTSGDLFAPDTTRETVREKVDVIEIEYASASSRRSEDSLDRWPRVARAIAPLLDRVTMNRVVRA